MEVLEKLKANLEIENKTIEDPNGDLVEKVKLASSSTENAKINLTRNEKNSNINVGTTDGYVNSVEIPLSEWKNKDGDGDTFNIGFTAVADADDRDKRQIDSDPKEVTLTVEKKDSPKMTIEAYAGIDRVTINVPKKKENYGSDGITQGENGGYLKIINSTGGKNLTILSSSVSSDSDNVKFEPKLDRELDMNETLNFEYRYNSRYKRSLNDYTVTERNIIPDTGVLLENMPYIVIISLLISVILIIFVRKKISGDDE